MGQSDFGGDRPMLVVCVWLSMQQEPALKMWKMNINVPGCS